MKMSIKLQIHFFICPEKLHFDDRVESSCYYRLWSSSIVSFAGLVCLVNTSLHGSAGSALSGTLRLYSMYWPFHIGSCRTFVTFTSSYSWGDPYDIRVTSAISKSYLVLKSMNKKYTIWVRKANTWTRRLFCFYFFGLQQAFPGPTMGPTHESTNVWLKLGYF